MRKELDIIVVQERIQTKIAQLNKVMLTMPDKIKAKAKTAAEYDRDIAKTIIFLKDEGTAVSIIDKMARGRCWEARYAMEEADAMYRATLSEIEVLKAQLNGFQSIFRQMSQIAT